MSEVEKRGEAPPVPTSIKEQMLRYLQEATEGATAHELGTIQHRFDASLTILRREGHLIVHRKLPSGGRYFYRGKVDVVSTEHGLQDAYYRTFTWLGKRIARLKIDGYQCSWCNARKHQEGIKLEVHHLAYNLFAEDVFTELMTLCARCHNLMHLAVKWPIFPTHVSREIADRITAEAAAEHERRARQASQMLFDDEQDGCF